jgi:hypothetical protein
LADAFLRLLCISQGFFSKILYGLLKRMRNMPAFKAIVNLL